MQDELFSQEIQDIIVDGLTKTIAKMMKEEIPCDEIFDTAVTATLTTFYDMPEHLLPSPGSQLAIELDPELGILTPRQFSIGVASFCVSYVTRLINEGKAQFTTS